MKTTTYEIPLAGASWLGWLWQGIPAVAMGGVSAVLVHWISVDGVFGLAGGRLPLAVVGGSAWLYAGLAVWGGHPLRGVAHLGFGVALFVAAIAAMSTSAASLAPWCLAQTVWVGVHARDIGRPLFVLGWGSFNAGLALSLMV